METEILTPEIRRERRIRERQERAARRMRGSLYPCSLQDLLFDVEVRKEELDCNSEFAYRIVGNINGKEKLLNQCSKYYELVKNVEIFPKVVEILEKKKIQYEAHFSHIGNVRFYGELRITDKRYSYKMKGGINDEIYPVLKIQHSYNGKTNYRIIFGYFRVVCTNGLTIAVEEMKDFNLVIIGKHTEAIKVSLAKLDVMLNNFVNNSDVIKNRIINKYEMLGGRIVTNVKDRVTEVLKANKISIVESKKVNTLGYITERIDSESKTLGYIEKTDWLIYNAINRYLNDNSLNISPPEKRMEKDSKIFEYMLENA